MVQVAVIALLVALPASAHHGGELYEGLFRQGITQYWRDTPHTWHLIDALADAESSYRPDVVSYAGAVGLLQVMPRTWREIRRQGIAIGDDATDPRDNIIAGSYYLRRMYRIFTDPRRSEDDRLRVALASYNAGPGHLLTAQKLAVEAGHIGVAFVEMAEQLPRVTGDHAAGTIRYSNKIVREYRAAQQTSDVAAVADEGVMVEVPTPAAAAPSPTVHVVVASKDGIDWNQLVGLLYILFSGGRKDDKETS